MDKLYKSKYFYLYFLLLTEPPAWLIVGGEVQVAHEKYKDCHLDPDTSSNKALKTMEVMLGKGCISKGVP